MEKEPTLEAIVKSPAIDAHMRAGNGFSLKEIKEAGKTPELLKKLNIKIDYFRKSAQSENIEKIKSLKTPKVKKKKKSFVMKEKKRTPYKPKIEKIKAKPKKIVKVEPKITPAKPVTKPKKKEKVKPVKLEKIPTEPAGTPLTELSGLGAATAKKFIELGVNNIEDLCQENLEELAALIKGVSVDRLKKWIDEGNELIK
ncbi:MAG: hypothetical protein CEE43_14740 [Promethearchaeota archaeon Loki_b32]|nr:MAG: hypothetical protein CEE43_14740 [Candidatus Lokiarchaeota archaeon Loki_b32]